MGRSRSSCRHLRRVSYLTRLAVLSAQRGVLVSTSREILNLIHLVHPLRHRHRLHTLRKRSALACQTGQVPNSRRITGNPSAITGATLCPCQPPTTSHQWLCVASTRLSSALSDILGLLVTPTCLAPGNFISHDNQQDGLHVPQVTEVLQ